jgi:hypothetical protein
MTLVCTIKWNWEGARPSSSLPSPHDVVDDDMAATANKILFKASAPCPSSSHR